jgi:hypothetical protein
MMTVRELDLPSILRRVALTVRQIAADPKVNSGVTYPIEIPDPVTLVDLADKAGLSLEWLLYGVRDQDAD